MNAPADRLSLVHVVDVRGAADRARVAALLRGGVTALWLRDPAATGRALHDAGLLLRATTEEAGALLLVGDRPDVACAIGADGVQLGHRAVPAEHVRPWYRGRVGVSCHDASDLRAAAAAGADHVILAPVFDVPGKGRPLGLEGLEALLLVTRLPVVALGGVTAANAGAVRAIGVAGVAVARALADAVDPEAAARALR